MQALTHIHMTIAGLSIAFFLIRALWLFNGSALLNKKPVKILPHIVDTILLGTGIALAVHLSYNPLEHYWLLVKIVCIVLYIGFGMMMFRASTKSKRVLFFLLSLVAVGSVIVLAHHKPLF